MFCRMFALPAGTAPIVLSVDVPERALTAAFQAAGDALAAIHLPCPGPGEDSGRNPGGHRLRYQGGPHRRRAHARRVPRARLTGGPGLPHPGPRAGPKLYLRDPADGRLERYALIVTGPDRADDADRLSTVGSAHRTQALPAGPRCSPGPALSLLHSAAARVPALVQRRSCSRRFDALRTPPPGRCLATQVGGPVPPTTEWHVTLNA